MTDGTIAYGHSPIEVKNKILDELGGSHIGENKAYAETAAQQVVTDWLNYSAIKQTLKIQLIHSQELGLQKVMMG